MRVGILGWGLMGGKLGTIIARAGQDVASSYARTRSKLEELARDTGVKRAGTPARAAKEADAIFLGVNWPQVDDVLQQASDLSGRVIVTCLAYDGKDGRSWHTGSSGSGSRRHP